MINDKNVLYTKALLYHLLNMDTACVLYMNVLIDGSICGNFSTLYEYAMIKLINVSVMCTYGMVLEILKIQDTTSPN